MHQAGSRRQVLGLLLAGCCLLLTWPGLAQEATPPGKTVLTISGRNIRIASPKLTTFRIEAVTPAGNIYMNIGFSEGE